MGESKFIKKTKKWKSQKNKTSENRWQKSNAKISGNGYNSFRKIVQTDLNELIITGNKGKMWRSVDSGKTWIRMALPDENDIYDISKKPDGNYVMVGSDGYVAEIRF